MLDFCALLSKGLCTFLLIVFELNYDLYVVFYVGFRLFSLKLTLKINQLKIKRPIRVVSLFLYWVNVADDGNALIVGVSA